MSKDYAIRGNDLKVDKKFIRERREQIHRTLDLIRGEADKILEHIERGWWITGNMMELGSLEYFTKSLKEELDQNYNINAKYKCEHCKEIFVGIMAYDRHQSHLWKDHKKEMDKIFTRKMILMFGVFAGITNSIRYSNVQSLYKETKSENAKKVLKLMAKCKDIPIDLMKSYYKDSDDYYNKQFAGMKINREPRDYRYLDKFPNGLVPGGNTIVKETAKALVKFNKKTKE